MPIGYIGGEGGPLGYIGDPEPVYVWIPEWELKSQYTEIPIERWIVAGDERTCPECAPLGWATFQVGQGPYPPLHINCRCQRVYAYSEWSVRYVWEESYQLYEKVGDQLTKVPNWWGW